MFEELIKVVIISVLLLVLLTTFINELSNQLSSALLIINSSRAINGLNSSLRVCMPALINNNPVRLCNEGSSIN